MPIQLSSNTTQQYDALDEIIASRGIEDVLAYLACEYSIALTLNRDPELEEIDVVGAIQTYQNEYLVYKTDTTQKTYRSEIEQFFRYLEQSALIRKTVVECFTPAVLSNYLVQAGGLVATQNKKKSFLRSLINFFIDQHWMATTNWKQTLAIGKVYEKIPRSLNPKQIDELLSIAKTRRYGLRYFVLFTFMSFTGGRIEEVSTLKWGQIDWDEKKAIVFGKHHRKDGRPLFPNNELLDLVLTYGRIIYGGNKPDWKPTAGQYVFSASGGLRPLSMKTIEDTFKACVKQMTTVYESLKPELTPHCLRHSFAVNALKSGVDLYTLSLLMGHADPKTTTVYTKLSNDDRAIATQKVTDYITTNGGGLNARTK